MSSHLKYGDGSLNLSLYLKEEIGASLIKAFATLFVLSYVKVLDVSRDLFTSGFTYYGVQHKYYKSFVDLLNTLTRIMSHILFCQLSCR